MDQKNIYENDADSTLKIIQIWDPKFHKFLLKFLNKDLRNSFAHSNYYIKNNTIYYNVDKKKQKKINIDTILSYFINCGLFINKIQNFDFKYRSICYRKLLQKKIIKKNIGEYIKNICLSNT
ncbi:MAG: hypothetical protein PHN22_03905 [Candidatus ainarchaeum sp.]|nr:hypothetical protein [Candidatus ainarchaeum sp.]